MVRYCTTVDCAKVVPVMAIFQRRRPWLFIPPVFCYFVTLSRLEHSAGFSGWTLSYYIMLAVLGIVFSLRDGLVGVEVPDEP